MNSLCDVTHTARIHGADLERDKMDEQATIKQAQRARQTQIQFAEIFAWMDKGWRKLPRGYVCPIDQGALWFRMELNGRQERHKCSCCGWTQSYKVK